MRLKLGIVRPLEVSFALRAIVRPLLAFLRETLIVFVFSLKTDLVFMLGLMRTQFTRSQLYSLIDTPGVTGTRSAGLNYVLKTLLSGK